MVLSDQNTPFLMEVEDAFAAADGGVIVSGKVKSGNIMVGDEVEIIGLSLATKRAVVAAKDVLFKGSIQLEEVTKDDLKRGQVLATPGTIKPYTIFLAHVSFFVTQAHIEPQPFLGTFRSLFHIRGTDLYGTMWLPEGTITLTPGDQMDVRIELQQLVALEPGLSFDIGRQIGRGTVTKLLD
jgi:elongation factor Tu